MEEHIATFVSLPSSIIFCSLREILKPGTYGSP